MAAPAETLKQETRKSYEQQSSFDILASINMMRFDISNHGMIFDETMERVHDEELSYIAEGIDRHSYTSFTLKGDPDKGLQFFDKGQWRSYNGMLLTGLEVAKIEARQDPRKDFLARNAERDLQIGYKMENLKPGETLIWESEFAEKEFKLYGEKFISSCGLQARRRMGFIYRAEKHQDGSLTLESHTIDNSDSDAFAAVRRLSEDDKNADMETLIRVYDGNMRIKYGAEYRAGRLRTDSHSEINAWDFVCSNKDLFNYYFSELTKLAYSGLEGYELREAKKNLTYGVWARTKEILNDRNRGIMPQTKFATVDGVVNEILHEQRIASEVHQARLRAVERGDVMVGCGGSIVAKSDLDDPVEVLNSIFGPDKPEKSSNYLFDKKMFCAVCQAPPKKDNEEKKMCGPCGICKGCDTKIRSTTSL